MFLFLFASVFTCSLSFAALPDVSYILATFRYIYRQQIGVMKKDLDCRPPVKTFNACKKGPVFESMIRHMLVHERRWKCTSCNVIGKL